VEIPPPAIEGDIFHFLLENPKDCLAFIFDALCGIEQHESRILLEKIDVNEPFI
jgi:hypothetical protein